MPLISTRDMLQAAQRGGYAVGAFNMENMEMAQAIVSAAEAKEAPVILQTTPSTIRYGGIALYKAIADALGRRVSIPVAIHLDHGDSYELAEQAAKAGYTSVMIDGSTKPFAENIAVTKSVVQMARSYNISIEAELGKVGGKEDDLTVEGDAYTNPTDAKDFIEETNVDSLAVAIGTAHGVYAKKPRLDIERLAKIRQVVDIPLVLHGASGLTDEDVRACVARGICKVNFATELRIAYTEGIRTIFMETPTVIDPKVYGKAGRGRVLSLVSNWLDVLGCVGKAR